jgi:acetyltransferase-like isoleucine patch superfamily enzyme
MELPPSLKSDISGLHSFEFGENVKHSASAHICVKGTKNRVLVGSDCDIGDLNIVVKGKNCSVEIGARCWIKKGTISVSGTGTIVRIGENTTWESGAIIANEGQSVSLGRDCMLASVILIRNVDGHGIFDGSTRERINHSKPVTIGEHVWLGNGARVNKGATIGDGVVVGHSSVVSGRLEGYCIYAGVPAKVIRRNIRWSRSDRFEDIPAEYQEGQIKAANQEESS